MKKNIIFMVILIGGIVLNAVAQDVAVFPQLGHIGGVYSAAISPDGKYALSGSYDNTLKLWDIATGREIRIFSGHTSDVFSIAFSPDGKQALSGSWDNKIKLWDINTGKEIKTFSGHTDAVNSVTFSPGGELVLSGSSDRTLKLWDIATGLEIKTFSEHEWGVTSVAFSHDGKQVLSGSGDATVKLWDIATGHVLRTFTGHTDAISSVAFSPDGNVVLSGSHDGTIKLWDISTSREISRLEVLMVGFEIVPDTSMATFSDHKDGVTSVAFSPDGKQFLSGSWDAKIKLWDIATGQEIRTFSGHNSLVLSVAFSPDGNQILSGSYDNTMKLWDTATGQGLKTFSGYGSNVDSVAFSPDGKRVIAGSGDSTIKLWDIVHGQIIRTFYNHSSDIYYDNIAYSPDGKQVVSGSYNNSLLLWDIETGQELARFYGHTDFVCSAVFSPDGKQILSGSKDKTIKLWDIASGQLTRTFSGHTEIVSSIVFSPDGKQALSGSGDKTIKLWDISTGQEVKTFSEHSSEVNSVAFSPDGAQALFGSNDETIKLRDINTDQETRTFTGHTDGVYSVTFSPDGRQALSGSFDNTVKLWDIATGKEIKTFSGHSSVVFSVAFSPDGKQALSGSYDGTVRLWDISSGNEIAQFVSFTDDEWIVITPDGYYKASPSGDRYINVRVGNSVYGIDEYSRTFYNPQIVEARLQGRPDPVQVAETIQDAASFEPPRVVISNPVDRADLTSGQVELSVTVVDQNQPITNIELVVNGSLVGRDGMVGINPGDRAVSRASPTLNLTGTENRVSFRYPVYLKEGKNVIEVIATNGKTTGIDKIEVNCLAASEQLHDLWILSIGVNSYDDNSNLNSLNYAVNDARAIIDAFKAQEGKLYGKVNSLLIADGADITPTTDNIRDRFGYFRQAGEQDVVLLFMAGHGMNDDGGDFYFMPADAAFGDDGSIRPSRAISYRDIQSVLDRPGQKLVFIDACHSEGTASRLTRSTDNVNLTNQLKNNSTFVFTSSKGNETSKELDELGHGAFTYAILEGLKGEAFPENDTITMLGLYLYVKRTVPQLTKSSQNPIGYTPDGLEDFPLADLR